MATVRGFVRSIEARGDGWVEVVVRRVHAGNGDQSLLISDLDGDLEENNRRLAQLGVLRDALARTLPVEVQYAADDDQGAVIEDVTVHHRPSFDGRSGTRLVTGTVIGIQVTERGPESSASPYTDEADVAAATILADIGSVEGVLVDLQRPDPMTGHAMLGLLQEAHANRRTVEVLVSTELRQVRPEAGAPDSELPPGFVQACRWRTVPEADLDYEYAFIERIGQRYESYAAGDPGTVSDARIVYTTAPGQTPEGDVSDNGAFVPATGTARLPHHSPLMEQLRAAQAGNLQVEIGLAEGDRIDSVEVVSHLGSAARPIWIEVRRSPLCDETATLCDNVPTVRPPDDEALNQVPHAVLWTGTGYFTEGIWRFAWAAEGEATLLIDGEEPCGECREADLSSRHQDKAAPRAPQGLRHSIGMARRGTAVLRCMAHAYLCGVHRVELRVTDRTCASPFRFRSYRLR